MTEFFIVIGVVSSTLICFGKWGWLDYYQVKRPEWMPDAGCFFCLGFWLSVVVWLLAGKGILAFALGFVCAPFINIVVSYARGKVE